MDKPTGTPMRLLDEDDATLLDRMERSPTLVLAEVKRLREVLRAALGDLPTFGTEWVRQGDHEFELTRVNPITHNELRAAVHAVYQERKRGEP